MITTSSPIIGKGGRINEVTAYAYPNGGIPEEVADYLDELFRLCDLVGFDFRILVSQSYHECFNPETGKPWDSHWRRTRNNFMGLGITGDPAQNEASPTFKTGADAARAHVVHMWAYAGGAFIGSGLAQYWDLDPRYEAVADAGFRESVRVLGDLGNGKWATDPNYSTKIRDRANAIFTDTGATPMASPFFVAKECPIETRVLTGAANNRPALPMPDASFVTVHEVGNLSPGADEDMHANFVHNGGGSNAVSFHWVVGPTKAIQLVYLNENAWHASDYYGGRGNRDSIAIETIQIGDFNKTLSHLAWLIAENFRNPDRFLYRSDVGRTDDLPSAMAVERTKQHNYWAPDKKNCPQFIRDRGLWYPLIQAVQIELKPTVPEITRYHPPILPSWWSEKAVAQLGNHMEDGIKYKPLGTRVTAIKSTGAYVHPWDESAKGKKTRANIAVGETVDLRYIVQHPTRGSAWGLTRYGSWIALQYFTPRFTIQHIKAG